MKILVMALLLNGSAAYAQQSPKKAELYQELRDKTVSVNNMVGSLAIGADKGDAQTLKKKLEVIRSIRKDMGEEAQLRLQFYEELMKLQMALHYAGEGVSSDEASLKRKLEGLTDLEAALRKNIDAKDYAAIKARDEAGRIKGNLSSLRSATQVYYGDNEGKFPENLSVLTEKSKYIVAIPYITPPGHKKSSNAVKLVSGVKNIEDLANYIDDAGGWLYVNDSSSPMFGTIVINCNHRDIGDNKPFMYSY